MQLEIMWKLSVPLRSCFYDLLGRSKALLSLGLLIVYYEGKNHSEYSPQGPMTQKTILNNTIPFKHWALFLIIYISGLSW